MCTCNLRHVAFETIIFCCNLILAGSTTSFSQIMEMDEDQVGPDTLYANEPSLEDDCYLPLDGEGAQTFHNHVEELLDIFAESRRVAIGTNIEKQKKHIKKCDSRMFLGWF